MHTKVVATGRALGSKRVDNRTLGKLLKLAPKDIEKRSGIQCRFWASEKETTSDLAFQASEDAMHRAGWKPAQIDLIILSTSSPDYIFPSTACLLQHRLSARNAFAFDINASCSGFLYALSAADQAIRLGDVSRALVVAAEIKSTSLNMEDPSTAILFGDGAGAVLLEATQGPTGLEAIFLHADGKGHHLIRLPGGGSRQPLSLESLKRKAHFIQMKGPSLFRTAIRKIEMAIDEALTGDWDVNTVDWFVFHQANQRIIERVAKKKNIPIGKIPLTLTQWGNTSSSSLPLALDKGARELFHPGDRILLISFGGGITWGTARLIW